MMTVKKPERDNPYCAPSGSLHMYLLNSDFVSSVKIRYARITVIQRIF